MPSPSNHPPISAPFAQCTTLFVTVLFLPNTITQISRRNLGMLRTDALRSPLSSTPFTFTTLYTLHLHCAVNCFKHPRATMHRWSHVSQPVSLRVRPAPNKGPNPPLFYELAITPPNAAKRARPLAYGPCTSPVCSRLHMDNTCSTNMQTTMSPFAMLASPRAQTFGADLRQDPGKHIDQASPTKPSQSRPGGKGPLLESITISYPANVKEIAFSAPLEHDLIESDEEVAVRDD